MRSPATNHPLETAIRRTERREREGAVRISADFALFPTIATAGLTPADANGYLVIDAEEGVVAPGVAAYEERYKSGGTQFDGCVMASKEDPSKGTCNLGPDSGKRFKLRATKLNEPIDIVLDVSTAGQTKTMLYNVFGKLTNETGKPATGFRVQLGKGIGADFVKSTATDGVSLKPTRESKGGTEDLLGKFPGGLFGGSQVEGLPFFTTQPANFNDVTQDGDTLIANSIPSQYRGLFEKWLSKESVPVAWAFDVDGRPWTDDKLLAWKAEDGKWYRFKRDWGTNTIEHLLRNFDGGGAIDLSTIPAELNPLVKEFADIRELTKWLNQKAGYAPDDKDAYKTGDVVDALVGGLTLTRVEVPQVKLDEWAKNPVTIRYSTDAGLDNPTLEAADAAGWPTIATWHPELGEEGLYVLDPGYDIYQEIVAIARTDLVAGKVVATAEDMETVVADNTSATTKFFAIPGYSMGEIEDLSNVNTFYAIEVDPSASASATTKFTLRLTVTDESYVAPADPSDPTPVPPFRRSSSGCTIANGDAPFDPTLPLLLVGGVAAIALRRRAAR